MKYLEYFNRRVEFDTSKYNFPKIIEEIFNHPLNKLHELLDTEYHIFTELGKDTNTNLHSLFYSHLHKTPEMTCLFKEFIKNVIFPYLNLSEGLYQVFPTFRIQLPDNVAVVKKHYDSDQEHAHPFGEINFIWALTDMFDTNSVWYESFPRKEDYKSMELKSGEVFCFNGNVCHHYNQINKTGVTRVSMDFRILPKEYMENSNNRISVTTNKKFIDGSYYNKMTIQNDIKKSDIWDQEKVKFNSVMKKYNVNDAWGVVDIFEKTIAEYAGSKYAVTVDCCTDALFLCLKYLSASGSVILPSRTWISVPSTVIHAGCEVEFENIEWSGVYQLKPFPIYDGAVRMKRGMYKPGTYHCLSFHIRKHIPIGKGGMILTDDKSAYDWFRTVRYEGRTMGPDGVNYLLYKDDPIKSMGWNMYMTPEQAARGLELFKNIKDDNPDQETSGSCKDLESLGIYNDCSKINKNKNIVKEIFEKNREKRLYLGCNDKYIDGFVNIDILENSKADIISDVTKLNEFDNNTIDLIYSSHMIEHVSRYTYKEVLKRWYNLIKPGGIIRLALPDLLALSKYYVEHGNINEVRGCMFGGQVNKYDYHYWGHDFNSLKKDLEEVGFINIKRFNWWEVDYNIKDWSRDYLPKHYDNGEMIPDEEWYKGTLVSLNIEATK